jgi:hypothetical protein
MGTIGVWSDELRADELDFTQKIITSFKSQNNWTSQLLNDAKIRSTLALLEHPKNMSTDNRKAVKADLFEIRIANAIYQSGCNAIYEYKTGVNKTSVDFLIHGDENKGQHDWLVELTSLRDSEDIKQATTQKSGIYFYISPDNNDEVKDIWRTQQAILSKVAKKPAIPIKFPVPNATTYNAIVIDMRAINLGKVDKYDLQIIMYGSQHLRNIDDGFLYREFITADGFRKPILGICDPKYEDPRARYFRERIHAVGFINEEKYEQGEINSHIQTYCNPHLIPLGLKIKLPIES